MFEINKKIIVQMHVKIPSKYNYGMINQNLTKSMLESHFLTIKPYHCKHIINQHLPASVIIRAVINLAYPSTSTKSSKKPTE